MFNLKIFSALPEKKQKPMPSRPEVRKPGEDSFLSLQQTGATATWQVTGKAQLPYRLSAGSLAAV